RSNKPIKPRSRILHTGLGFQRLLEWNRHKPSSWGNLGVCKVHSDTYPDHRPVSKYHRLLQRRVRHIVTSHLELYHNPSVPHFRQSCHLLGNSLRGKPPYSIQWDLGDGSTSTINPTTYTYILPGSYTVKLTATDKNNFVTTSASVVNVSPPLLTTFSFSPSIPKQGQPVTFTASATGGTSPYSFIWNFGDGSAGSGSSTTHTYYSSGTFTVILTAM